MRSLLLLATLLLPQPTASDPAPSVEISARAIAPGEPLRVWVRSAEPLLTAAGEFLGRRIDFVPTARDGTRWAGWTLVDLDAGPGDATLSLTFSTSAGDERVTKTTTTTIVVEPKAFPEERLTVSSRYVEPPADVQERLAEERARLAAIYRSREAPIVAGPFVRPVPGEPTCTFGKRRIFNGKPRSPHPGLDLRAAKGTTVRASGAGDVVLARDLYYSGNTVILDHGGGLFTLYAHLSRIDVREGQRVAAAQPVGLSGATGRVTGPHLHWGAKIGDVPFDPTALLEPGLFAEP